MEIIGYNQMQNNVILLTYLMHFIFVKLSLSMIDACNSLDSKDVYIVTKKTHL